MNGVLGSINLVIIMVFFSFSASAKEDSCIKHKDLLEIAESFSQIKKFVGSKSEYCESDLGSKWLSIINSLVVLKNIKQNAPDVDENDAFTHEAITERNWWSYFTKRARFFIIPEECRDNVVAYVNIRRQSLLNEALGIKDPHDGNIHLCKPFFKESVSSQASTMMHEVRHFDQLSHVQCTRGLDVGAEGACDNSISEKGSYAISVQTLVGIARSPDTDEKEKPLLEAEALYLAFNRFNTTPRVALKNSIFLSNESGEVYKWRLEEDDSKLVTVLDEPARVINSFNNMTVYPLNLSKNAYRTDSSFKASFSNPGSFAVDYNNKSVSERADYSSVSYFGTGGMLKGNDLITTCEGGKLFSHDVSEFGEMHRMISISADFQDMDRLSALLTKSGDVIAFACKSRQSSDVLFSRAEITFTEEALNSLDSFGLAGTHYALLSNGSLAKISLNGSTVSSEELDMPLENQNWVSATPISMPKVF